MSESILYKNLTSVERKTSFVTKTTVFLEPERKRSNAGVSGSNPAGPAGHLNLEIQDLNSERVKFDSSSLPTSPTSEEISTTSSIGGGMIQRCRYRVLQTIQIKLIILCVWAELAVLGSAKNALKFK